MPAIDNKDLSHIMGQNEEWRQRMIAENPDYFYNTRDSQHPEYLWVGCSDARVPANVLMGEKTDTVLHIFFLPYDRASV